MADRGRQPQPDLSGPVEQMDFFELLRRLEAGAAASAMAVVPSASRRGSGRRSAWASRLHDVGALEAGRRRRPPQVTVKLLGLLGPEGPLPLHLSRRVLDRLAQRWFSGDVEARPATRPSSTSPTCCSTGRWRSTTAPGPTRTRRCSSSATMRGRVRAMLAAMAGAGADAIAPVKLGQAAALGHQVLGPERLDRIGRGGGRAAGSGGGVRGDLGGDPAAAADPPRRRARDARAGGDARAAQPSRGRAASSSGSGRSGSPASVRCLPGGERLEGAPARDPARPWRDPRRRRPPGAAGREVPGEARRGDARSRRLAGAARRPRRRRPVPARGGRAGGRRPEGGRVSILLTLVEAPNPQAVRQMRLDDGELVIGRSAEADWRLDDPSGWVSRAHCTIAGRGGSVYRHGYLDQRALRRRRGAAARARPAGAACGTGCGSGSATSWCGSSCRPRRRPPRRRAARPQPRSAFDADDFFTKPVEAPPRPVRPRDLPDPFERPASFVPAIDTAPPERRAPPVFDDPFTLDQPTSRHRERPAPADFDWGNAASPPPDPAPADRDFDWASPKDAPEPRRAAAPEDSAGAKRRSRRTTRPAPTGRVRRPSPRGSPRAAAAAARADRRLRRRALRGVPARRRGRPGRCAGRRRGADGGVRARVPDDGRGADAAAEAAGAGEEHGADAADGGRCPRGQSAQVHALGRRRAGEHGRAAVGRLRRRRRGDRRRAARSRRASRRDLARDAGGARGG